MNDPRTPRIQERLRTQRTRTRDASTRRALGNLADLLDRAGPDREQTATAEALVALRLVRAGFAVQADVPAPNGRSCDFLATRGGGSLAVHVKRLRSGDAVEPTFPPRLRDAIHGGRAVLADAWWSPRLPPRELGRLGRSFGAFLREAAIGESLSVRDAPDVEIGRIRILRPAARRLELRVERADRAQTLARIERLALRAFEQCLPRVANVIALVGDHAGDWELLDTALNGGFVERWDRFPARGQRRAYGRADDGLWSHHRAPWCRLAASLTMRRTRDGVDLSPGVLLRRGEDAADDAERLARRALLRSR
jgi:hypothetical protein